MCNSLAKYHVCGNVLYQLHTQSLYQVKSVSLRVVIATGRDVVNSCDRRDLIKVLYQQTICTTFI
jgi:hypothetical protein